MKAKEYGQWLRKVRRANGMSILELAREADITPDYLGHIEGGRVVPTEELMDLFEDILGETTTCRCNVKVA